MTRFLYAAAVAVLAVVLVFALGRAFDNATASTNPCIVEYEVDGYTVCVPDRNPAHPCVEDEPCWDCATMGNRVCGGRS